MRRKTIVVVAVVLALSVFLAWRFLRPLNIFVVSEAFERPVDTRVLPQPLSTLRAANCGSCHREIYREWRTTIHSRAWLDPYFQVDWKFDGSQQICKNCHIPLDRQQEHLVLGFHDADKWQPILADNPDFDPALQHEGVTCAACHVRDGKVRGPRGTGAQAHAVEKMGDPNAVCVRCHVVQGERWDTFLRVPPCGTVAEIEVARGQWQRRSGEVTVRDPALLGCVDCHMPLTTRPVVTGGKPRETRRHLWRGGHDPDTVKRGLEIRFSAQADQSPQKRGFTLTLTNTGAAHFIPTGTPDRHLSVALRLLGRDGKVLREDTQILKRTIMWRPFIVDLWDTRLVPGEPRVFRLQLSDKEYRETQAVEAVVRYHLLDEKRRARIGYQNAEPIAYEVFRQRLNLPLP